MAKVVKAILAVALIVVGAITGQFELIGVGLGVASSIITPKKKKQEATESRLSKRLDPEEYVKIVFGETAGGTDIRYWEVWGTDNMSYDEVICIAGHKIQEFGSFYIEDEEVTFSGEAATGAYAGVLSRKTKLEGNNTILSVGAGGTWKITGANGPYMTGLAYYVLAWVSDPDKLPRGPATRITQVVKGALVYDPRKDSTQGGSGTHRAAQPSNQSTWQYTPLDSNNEAIGRNPALQILWYLLGWYVQNPSTSEWVLRCGMGVPPDSIDYASFITAANDCEDNNYYSDCILSTGNSHEDNLGTILAACAGKLIDAGGLYRLKIAKDDTADVAVELSADDIVGEDDWQPEANLSDKFNQGHGTFVDPDTLYQRRNYPLVRDTSYETADGYKHRKSFDYDAVQSSNQAQALTRLEINKARFTGTYTAPFNWRACLCNVTDIVKLTSARHGFTDKIFRVEEREFDPAGPVNLVLREDDASIYTPGTVTTLPAPGVGAGFDPRDVPVPSSGDWTVSQYAVTDGSSSLPALKVSGDAPSLIVKQVTIEISTSSSGPWTSIASSLIDPDGTTDYIIPSLPPSTIYYVALRYINTWGVKSARTVLGPVTTPSEFQAQSIINQGGLATKDIVDWETEVGGSNRPEDNATVGTIGMIPAGIRVAEGSTTIQLYANTPDSGSIEVGNGFWKTGDENARFITGITVLSTPYETHVPTDGVFYVIWGVQDANTRFPALVGGFLTETGFFCAEYNRVTGEWSAVDSDNNKQVFLPLSTDILWGMGTKNAISAGIDLLTQIVAYVEGFDAPGVLSEGTLKNQDGVGRSIPTDAAEEFVYDGDAIVFDEAWPAAPVIRFGGGGRTYNPTFNSSQQQVFRAINLTTTGFTASLKIREATGTITPVTDAGATTPGTGPTYQIEKSVSAQDKDDSYTYRFSVSCTDFIDGEGISVPNSGWVTVGFYTRTTAGGAWTKRGSVKYYNTGTYEVDIVVDGLGSAAAFGITAEAVGTGIGNGITSFVHVYYETQASISEDTATPSGVSAVPFFVIGNKSIV